jgi:hypothetical protein
MEHSFELVKGRINLVLKLKVWGENIVEYRDVHDEIVPIFNESVDIKFNGYDYKMIDGVLTYVGTDKDKYQK